MLAVVAVVAGTVLSAGQAAVETVAVLLLAVRFGALAAPGLWPPESAFLPDQFQFAGVELDIGAAEALAVLATEETAGKALAVQFKALRFLAVASKPFSHFGSPGFWSLDGDERVVLEHVLEPVVAGELDGVELAQFNLTSLPLPEQLAQHVLLLLPLAAHHRHCSLGRYFEGYSPGIGRHPQLADLHIKSICPTRETQHNQQPFLSITPRLPLCAPNFLFRDVPVFIMGNNPGVREKETENQMLVGFQNKPLTLCYANSILQVLFHHPVFTRILEAGPSNGIIGHLKELLESVRKRKAMEAVSTSKLMKFVQKESAIFERQRHQDCHEFYIWLMNCINDQLKEGRKKEKGADNNEKQEQTSLQTEFFSKRVTRTECSVCKTVSEREEEEVDLSFIMPEPNVSLNYCISTYSKEEKLSGRDKFKCDRCGDLVEAGKCSLIKTLPSFLSVHLRRFKYDEAKRGITKLNWQICFPYKLKIKTNYWEKAGQPQKDKEGLYRLVGVVVHLGTGQNYGHYISYIRIGNRWFVFNDDEITETEDYLLESLWGYKGLSKCAYMLFYTL